MDDLNAASIYFHALRKDCPGKLWWQLDHMDGRAAIYKALRIDPADHGAAYALVPFRVYRSPETGKASVLAAYPAPRAFDLEANDWLDVATVIAWNPVKDTARVLGDATPQLVGALDDDANAIFASPRAFFQAWAQRRAAFAVSRQTARQKAWHAIPAERDEVPGALMIGTPAAIRWNPAALPAHIECRGIDPAQINRAILRAARLPRVTGQAA